MKLESQVTSLKYAKRLKELKCQQESLWYWTWVEWNEKTEWVLISWDRAIKLKKEKISAFTVAEHGKELPDGFHSVKFNQIYRIEYNTDYIKAPMQADKNEANARAKMLVYLIKNKLAEVEKDV